MCTEVRIDAATCTTPRQLAARIGSDRIEWLEHHREMDWCLCVVDVPATLRLASRKWTQDETGLFVVQP